MAYERPRIIEVTGRTITIAHLEIPSQPQTLLTSTVSASGTSLSVLDNSGLSQNQLILIGELGSDTTEIKKVNAAVSAGTSLTSTAVTFSHAAGTPIRRVLFNQWKIYGNSTNTTIGATLIDTVDMQVASPFTSYTNTGTEYAYYFALPYDSLNTVTGDTYSDGVAKDTSYDLNSVGYILEEALKAAKAERTGTITDRWMIGEINSCMMFVSRKLKRWPFLQSFDYVLGQTAMGTFSASLPSDIQDPNTYKSILGVRIGGGENLTYVDKREWEEKTKDLVYTDVRTQASAADTTLEIDNSYDFADSGTAHVYVSGTRYDITYTGVTRSATTGVLTGIPASGTGSITVTIPVDTKVYQDEDYGTPKYFSVWDGSLYYWPLPDSSNDNMNIYLDYFTSRTQVNSAGDALDTSRYDLVKHWLTWKIRSQNNASGALDMTDSDKIMFDTILSDMIRLAISGQKYKMKPKVNKITL